MSSIIDSPWNFLLKSVSYLPISYGVEEDPSSVEEKVEEEYFVGKIRRRVIHCLSLSLSLSLSSSMSSHSNRRRIRSG